MIKLFHIPEHHVYTGTYNNLLHDMIVTDFEVAFAAYVSAKYACSFSSATMAIMLALQGLKTVVSVPSIIPHVVLNAILQSGNHISFTDNIEWVGGSYTLYQNEYYKIIDSAHKVNRNQFKDEACPNDLMVFSFYPTKPVGGCDGGMIVSNDYDKILVLRILSMNGTNSGTSGLVRDIQCVGWKCYMNSIQAAIALKSLCTLEARKIRLSEIRTRYNEAFNIDNSSDHLYRISVKNNLKFIAVMAEYGITCGLHYPAYHAHPVYAQRFYDLPASEWAAQTTVSIPFHVMLIESDIMHIIENVRQHADDN